MIKYLSKYIFKYRIISIIVLPLIAILNAVLIIISPLLSGDFIDKLISSNSMNFIIRYACVLIAIKLIGIGLNYISMTIFAKLQINSSFDISKDMLMKLYRVPYLKILKLDKAYLSEQINSDSNTVSLFFINNYINFFLNLIILLLSLTALYNINKEIFFTSIVFIPIYVTIYLQTKKSIYRRSLEFKEEQSRYFNSIYNQIHHIKSIKITALFDENIQNFTSSFMSFFKSFFRNHNISYLFKSLDNIVSTVFQSIVLIIGGKLVIDGNLSVGEFTIITVYFNIMIGNIKYYFSLGQLYQNARTSYERLMKIADIKNENNGEQIVNQVSYIYFNNVTFEYMENNPIIKSFNCEFSSGNIYLITGSNGAGKSTLMDILIGLIEAKQGNIMYNHKNYSLIDMYNLRKNSISVVQQEPVFPSATVQQTLIFNLKQKNIDEIKKVVLQKNLLLLFENEFYKWDEFINKKTYELSGGEKQKLAFIIAVIKDLSVLILDEPTSALDTRSTDIMLNYLSENKNDKITIIISHDKRILGIADKTIPM